MKKNLWNRFLAGSGAFSLCSLALLVAVPGGNLREQNEDVSTGPTVSGPGADNGDTTVTPFQPTLPEESFYGGANPNTNNRGYSGGGYSGQPYAQPYSTPREGISTSPTAGPSGRTYSTNGSDVGVTSGYGTGGIGTTGSTLSVSPNNPTPVTGY